MPIRSHRFVRTITATCLALLIAPAITRADLADDHIQAQGAKVDEFLQTRLSRLKTPGVSVAVVRNGKLLLSRSYGLAQVELGVPASPGSVYQIGSITKQFTATAIMMLVEEGKIGLDEKVSTYLPNLPEAWAPITVRHLLTHTSGLKNYTDINEFWKAHREPITSQELIGLVAKNRLDFTPGARWSYSNTGYFLLGMIIEKVSGKRYGTFLNERIFQPLHMTATAVNDFDAILKNRAAGYTLFGTTLRNAQLHHPSRSFAAGAIVSSVEDLAKWDAALYTDQLLPQTRLEEMWKPVKLNSGSSYPYGFGWGISSSRIEHGGGINGFVTQMTRYRRTNVTVIVLTNFDSADVVSLADGIHTLVTRDLPTP